MVSSTDFKNSYFAFIDSGNIPEAVKSYIKKDNLFYKNPEFYFRYSEIFSDVFKNNDPEHVTLLNNIGTLYFHSVLLHDEKMDNRKEKSSHNTDIFINYMQEEALRNLSHLFPRTSVFWQYWNLRKDEYFKGLYLDKTIRKSPTLKKYELLADFKSALGKVAIDSAFVITQSGDISLHEKMMHSHSAFSVGFQLMDDISDLKEDFENGQFNWAYYYGVKKLKKKKPEVNVEDINEFIKHFYIQGVGEELYKLADSYFKKSLSLLKNENSIKWQAVVQSKISETQRTIDEIKGYFLLLQHRNMLANAIKKHNYTGYKTRILDTPAKAIIQKALTYIFNEANYDFPEIKHLMYLSRREGFKSKAGVHVTDTFQRAVLGCIISELDIIKSPGMQAFINTEMAYLITRKEKDKTGGWSYYPTVKEISADADDLGQMMQLFIKNNRYDLLDEHCTRPLDVLLKNEFSEASGAITTWILPAKRNALQDRKNYFNETKWGKGPDNEVMGNILTGMAISGRKEYEHYIQKGIDYLLKQQHHSGYWESRWYYGNYYGTMIIVTLLAEFKEQYKQATDKAQQFIISTQNEDGGWGIDKNKSDALNTAFAISCLKFCGMPENKIIKKGFQYLKNSQCEDFSWNSTPFIYPRGNDPYQSKTITTAFVIKCLNLYNS